MEKLDKELADDVHLVARESLNCNEDGGSGNDESKESMNSRCREETGLDGLRVGQGCVGRFIRGRGQEVWDGKEE